MNSKYCVYFHINKEKHEIFYVGMGDYKRPYSRIHRNKWWHNITNKYKNYDIQIVNNNLSWEGAHNIEKYYIKCIGRRDLKKGTLVNLTNGGDGTNGYIVSDKTKKKIGVAFKGRIFSKEHKEKLRLSNTGRKLTTEQKRKLSEAKKGFKHTEETKRKIGLSSKGNKYALGYKHTKEAKQNISKNNKGRIVSEETRKKLSLSNTGHKHSDETKKKMSIINTGKKLSEEIKLKISLSGKKAWVKRKKLL